MTHKTTLVLFLILFLGLAGRQASAQEDDFSVTIARPGEGETFYTGPTSFLYRAGVTGWVTGYGTNPEDVEVHLEIFQRQDLLGSQVTRLQSRGTFNFYVTVNPDSPQEEFPPELGTCAYSCHTPSHLGLPEGPMLLRVTVFLPDGRRAMDERQVAVDRAENATIPVRLEHAEDPGLVVPGIPVKASTWLYMWRARLFSGATDSQGLATLHVEALSRAPTRYLFQVEPTVVDGVYYQSLEPVEVVLPAGASTFPEITLRVASRTGQITGQLVFDRAEIPQNVPITAVRLPQGDSYQTVAAEDGTFVFTDLPIAQYCVMAANHDLQRQDLYSQSRQINLADNVNDSLTLSIASLHHPVKGTIMDEQGARVPFAWITSESTGETRSTWPLDGSFTWYDTTHPGDSLVVTAPGFFSHALQVDNTGTAPADIKIQLVEQPGTRTLAWGDGSLHLPAESQIQIEGDTLQLVRGWVWGYSGASRPLMIETGKAAILLTDSRFAIETLPGQREWLFVFEGQAALHAAGKAETITVQAGEMINLADDLMRQAVSYNEEVLFALRPEIGSILSPEWRPTLRDKIQTGIARIGVGLAQTITIITYLLGFLAVLTAPMVAVYRWFRHRRQRRQAGWRSKKKDVEEHELGKSPE